MHNLKQSSISDSISIIYCGPGFYSGKPTNALQSDITLEKVADEYHDKEEVYQFCKMNGYKIKPFKVETITDIPEHWEIYTGEIHVQEYEDDDNL